MLENASECCSRKILCAAFKDRASKKHRAASLIDVTEVTTMHV